MMWIMVTAMSDVLYSMRSLTAFFTASSRVFAQRLCGCLLVYLQAEPHVRLHNQFKFIFSHHTHSYDFIPWVEKHIQLSAVDLVYNSVRVLFLLVLAFALIVAVVLMAFKPSFNIPPEKEAAASALVGVTSGLLGGASSLMGPIVISYMMSLKLSRDEFVGCISVIYLNAAWPLYLAMWHFGRMSLDDVGYSFIAIIPMFLGLQAGQKIRHRLSEETFRRALLGFLMVVAVMLLFR